MVVRQFRVRFQSCDGFFVCRLLETVASAAKYLISCRVCIFPSPIVAGALKLEYLVLDGILSFQFAKFKNFHVGRSPPMLASQPSKADFIP